MVQCLIQNPFAVVSRSESVYSPETLLGSLTENGCFGKSDWKSEVCVLEEIFMVVLGSADVG